MVRRAAAAAGALPGPDFLANPAARASRQLTSIRNLSSKRLAFEAGASEVLGAVPGGVGGKLEVPASPMVPAQLPRENVLEMALLQNAFFCYFRIPIRHKRLSDRSGKIMPSPLSSTQSHLFGKPKSQTQNPIPLQAEIVPSLPPALSLNSGTSLFFFKTYVP